MINLRVLTEDLSEEIISIFRMGRFIQIYKKEVEEEELEEEEEKEGEEEEEEE